MKKKHGTIVKWVYGVVIALIIIAGIIAIACYAYYDLINTQDPFYPDFDLSIIEDSCVLNQYTGDDEEVVIPKQSRFRPVESINDNAFKGCYNVKSITIPNSVVKISSTAFHACTSLERFVTNDDNPNYSSQDGILYDKEKTTIVRVPHTKTEVNIPNSVTTICPGAFDGCKNIKSITLPESVTVIGAYAFLDCKSLESINIPNNVTAIGNQAFQNCTRLTQISMPDSVTFMGNQAFRNCTDLTKIRLSENITSIDDYTFRNCTNLTEINIPENAISIGDFAFEYCTSLASVTIGKGVTSINAGAFGNCTSLTSVIFKNTAGWKVSKNNMSVNVTDPAQNATYLKSTYSDYSWQRG